jgi:alkylation response protein AidB-like acyl-CoA dehydrogenase
MEWFETGARMQLVDTAERFARTELMEGREETEGKPDVPLQVLRKARDMGFLTAPLTESFGGIELDLLSETMLWEGIARGTAGAAALMAVHSTALSALVALQEVPPVQEWLGTGLTEESDPPSLTGLVIPEPVMDHESPLPPLLREDPKGGKYSLQGRCICLLPPPLSTRLLLLLPGEAEDAWLFWLQAEQVEAHTERSWPGTGLEEMPKGRLVLSDFTPAAPVVLVRGSRGLEHSQRLISSLRLALVAIQMGNAAAALHAARLYAGERVQTGRIIMGHQEVRKMITHMETLLQAGRSLSYRAAACTDDLPVQQQLIAQADLFCGSVAEQICLDAIQVLGGYGYMKDYGLEKRLRDCKTLQSLLGSHPIDWLVEDPTQA